MPEPFSPELQSILEEEGISSPEPTQTPDQAPPDTPASTPSFDLGAAAADVTLGIPEAVGMGAVNSVGETIEGLYSAADWLANRFGGDLPDKEYVPYEPQTKTGQFLEPVARFVTGFIGAGKILKMAGWASKGGKLLQAARAAVQGGLADFFSFDAHEQRLSNLIQENPALRNPVSEYLKANPDDPQAEGRLKNVVEGLGLGVATEGFVKALRQFRRIRLLRAAKGDAGAAKTVADNAGSIDAELDKLFPPKKPLKIETKVEGKILPTASETQVTAYAQEINRVLGGGGDPTRIQLEPYLDPKAFQNADAMQLWTQQVMEAVRAHDPVVSHGETIEAAEKEFTQTVSSLADLTDTTPESLTQTLLRDAHSVREAGVRGVVISNALNALATEAERLAPLVKNLDDDAARQLAQLQEAAYRIVPADSLVGSELGRSLNARKIRTSFAKDAAEILKNPGLNPLELADALQNAKSAYARARVMQLTFDTITRVRINAMLSGPVTQMANMTSNLLKTALTPAEYVLGGMLQSGRGLASGQEAVRQGLSLYRGLWAGMADSWRMAGSAIRNRRGAFRGGDFSQLDVFGELDKAENLVTNPADALKFATLNDLKAASERIQHALDSGDHAALASMVWSTGLRTLGAVIDLPTTLLNGADEFFLNLNGRATLYADLTERGLKRGLAPGSPELSQFIETNFQRYFSQNGAMLQHDDAGRRAFAYATDSNFSKAMTGDTIFGRVGMMLKKGTDADGTLGFVMQNLAPFIRTPVNLLEDALNHIPGVNAALNQAVRDDLRAGGLRQARRLGEMVTGSMFLATAAALASQGVLTGSGPTNPQLRDQMKKAGWRPYALRIPDAAKPGGFRYFELSRFDPYSTYFMLVADFMEAQQAGGRGDMGEFYAKMTGSVVSNLSSRKYLTGMIDVMDLISGLAYGDTDAVEKFGLDFAGSFAPSLGKSVRELQDPLFREARSLVDAVRNRTPFLSEAVPVQYDFRGKPTLTPVLSLYSRSDMDAVDAEVLRLGQLGGQVDAASSQDRRFLSRFRGPSGKTAYERLGELMGEVGLLYYRDDMEGQTLTDRLRALIASPDYRAASDPFTSHDQQGQGGKVALLRNEIARYRDAAMEQLLLEGFKNGDGEGLARALAIKKTIPRVRSQDDLQQFLQGDTGASGENPDTYAPIFQFGQ